MGLPNVVTREEWLGARQELLAREKAATRARDALNARRRELPMVEIEKLYVFEGPDGKAELLDLFEGRSQLIVYHFMFGPDQDAGCPNCSAFLDQIGHLSHLRARDTEFAAVSRAPFTRLLPFKARMGWTMPWYSSATSDFNQDFGFASGEDPRDLPGLSCFLRDGDRVYHTYSTTGRGLDGIGSINSLLDLTALGRQEEWEEPRGRASALGAPAGGARVRYHDEYLD
ncbi:MULTISPECIES: DUF899 domain-containing protein [unclassified Streptomyces]|uniref:DUF899 domain-containing protein n=1 Tax=unclassified Streptomyces TaxID=2593676 RepID=UPI002DD89118|nr:DUF899 domain-containing protein [Streptomyces sp. NBC_01445]WSE07883.1 DUF899 domain-containing protein [Streptomyces sp. NBC_01445]